ncbi:MAG: hypothetical protein RLZZ399_1712 [Verrucomicrobiota bacterium]|jgi:membrane protein involved in D-alanine export
MVPFADFTYFGLLTYVLVPFLIAGLWGCLNKWWVLGTAAVMLLIQASGVVSIRPDFQVSELLLLTSYSVFQALLAWGLLRWKSERLFYLTLALSLLPLVASKLVPIFFSHTVFGFMGISYLTFRSLDVLLSVRDGVIKQLSPAQYFSFLLFFPTLSSGPVDRYRRFGQDWDKRRSREEFLDDFDVAISRVARGFLYKFIIAALIKTYWMDAVSTGRGAFTLWSYMYAYTFYLFFDFAGYSSFAVGVGRVLGIRVPENFDKPFLSKNIRDFWSRWHISLSFWFRDHIYMRFLLAASKGKWFQGKNTASTLGSFITFGLMGVWHGLSLHYILYGLYHAALLSAYDWFSRWNKTRQIWGSGRWQWAVDVALTFHAFSFGLLLFSGRMTPPSPPKEDFQVEKIDSREIVGFLWNRNAQSAEHTLDLVIDDAYIERTNASLYREDLRDRGYGSGRHGFRLTMPWWIRDGRPHTVEIRDGKTALPLKGFPQNVEFERDEEEIQREEAKLRKLQEGEALKQQESQTGVPSPR